MPNQHVPQEKRKFSRVKTRLKAYARKIESPKAKPLFSGSPSYDQDIPLDRLKTQLPEQLIIFLKNMESKLDMVLSLLNQKQLESEFPLKLDVQEISGAGLKFVSSTQFKLDEHIEIALVLNQFPLKMLGMIGTIIRYDKIKDCPVWVVGYSNIRNNDREAIVQYVFQEQREIIRGKKDEC